ncbi:MAG TPA: cupin domain-containing protein [Acidimicrobiales bacterium]|nr:cupin domain-containing protein [Acidimicrobiales bacterium]
MTERPSLPVGEQLAFVALGLSADDAVRLLGLEAHPEGGWYRETWRDTPESGGRGAGTAIYYLLEAGEESRWHRVDATEVWHLYGGGPMELSLSADGSSVERRLLGSDLAAGQRPQQIVPAGVWQSARPLGAWALVGCTVSPAFEFAGFELAPDGWQPER